MKKLLFLTIILVVTGSAVTAQTKTRVRFARGASSANVSGTIRGYLYHDYVVRASAGQTIAVSLDPNTKCVLTVFKPDGYNLDIGADREFTSELPVSGDYEVRVLLMRSEARRKTVSSYKLTISIK